MQPRLGWKGCVPRTVSPGASCLTHHSLTARPRQWVHVVGLPVPITLPRSQRCLDATERRMKEPKFHKSRRHHLCRVLRRRFRSVAGLSYVNERLNICQNLVAGNCVVDSLSSGCRLLLFKRSLHTKAMSLDHSPSEISKSGLATRPYPGQIKARKVPEVMAP